MANFNDKERAILLELVTVAIDETIKWDHTKQTFVTITGKEKHREELLTISRKLKDEAH